VSPGRERCSRTTTILPPSPLQLSAPNIYWAPTVYLTRDLQENGRLSVSLVRTSRPDDPPELGGAQVAGKEPQAEKGLWGGGARGKQKWPTSRDSRCSVQGREGTPAHVCLPSVARPATARLVSLVPSPSSQADAGGRLQTSHPRPQLWRGQEVLTSELGTEAHG
jgi:hypothetical protein